MLPHWCRWGSSTILQELKESETRVVSVEPSWFSEAVQVPQRKLSPRERKFGRQRKKPDEPQRQPEAREGPAGGRRSMGRIDRKDRRLQEGEAIFEKGREEQRGAVRGRDGQKDSEWAGGRRVYAEAQRRPGAREGPADGRKSIGRNERQGRILHEGKAMFGKGREEQRGAVRGRDGRKGREWGGRKRMNAERDEEHIWKEVRGHAPQARRRGSLAREEKRERAGGRPFEQLHWTQRAAQKESKSSARRGQRKE